MEIKVIRKIFTEDYTVGELYINGDYFCDTLELTTRKLEKASDKVPNKTAIPYGKYQVKLTYSNHFKRVLPEILNVLFFSGARIHIGNTIKDTRGCVLVGKYIGKGTLAYSTVTFNALMKALSEDKDNLTIEIIAEQS